MSSFTTDVFDAVNRGYEELNSNQKNNVHDLTKIASSNQRSAKWSVQTSKKWLLDTIVTTMSNPSSTIGKSTHLVYVNGGTLYPTELPDVEDVTKTVVPCVTDEEMVTMCTQETKPTSVTPKNKLRLFVTFNREISVNQFCRWLGFDESWSASRLSSSGLNLYKNVSYEWLNYFVGFCTLYKNTFVTRGTFAVREQQAILKKRSYQARKYKARLLTLQKPMVFEYAWSQGSVQSMLESRIKVIRETQQELYLEQEDELYKANLRSKTPKQEHFC